MCRHSAISAPVSRNRRSAAISLDAPLVGAVRDTSAALRSDPAARSDPQRGNGASHLRAVRSLIPAASAAALSDHPACSTRSTNSSRPFTLSAGVSVQLHPVSSLGLSGLTPLSLQGGPDEQRAQELHLGPRSGRDAASRCPHPSGTRS